MLHTTARTFRAPEIQLPDSVQQLWRTLQAADGHLPDLDQFGAGEVTGGHLRVRFVRDSEDQLFACEVTDLIHARWWEAGFARLAVNCQEVISGSRKP